jgi:hypothetical protein
MDAMQATHISFSRMREKVPGRADEGGFAIF